MVNGTPLSVCSTPPSWILPPEPMVMGSLSPRSTVLNQSAHVRFETHVANDLRAIGHPGAGCQLRMFVAKLVDGHELLLSVDASIHE